MQASKPGREELQVNQFNQNVPNLLLKFAKQGRLADLEDLIVKFLQAARSCVNQLDKSGLCPLHYAARNGQLGCIRKLVELLSADVNIESHEGKTALHFAAMHRRRVQNDAHSSEHKTENDSGIHEPPALDSKEHLHRHAKEQKPLSIPSCPVRPSGSCPLVRFLLEHGAHVNAKDILGRTALHYAAIHGDELATRQLLHDVNIDVNIPDHNGTRPLHLAALHNEAGIFRQLLNKKANIYVEDHCGCLPIHYACSSGNLGLVEMLCGRLESNETVSMLNKKNRGLETPLHWAVTYGHIQITDYCLKMGADLESKTKSGETCLHKAARCGNLELVTLLLDRGAVLDAEDELAQTPIHKAAEHNGAEVLRYLLKREIDTEVQDRNSYTPLLLCASKGHIDTAEVLIEAGANIFAQEAEGKNFVHLCVEENRLQFLKLFLGHPTADSVVHVADIFDRTPLHTAAEKGCVDILQLLIEHGAAIDAKDDRGRTALHYAVECGHLRIATCLLSICPQLLNSLDDASNTAAHYASQHGHSSLLRLLLNSGAMADSQNNRCHTPLHYAAAGGHLNCAELLLKHNASVNPLAKSTVGPLHLSCRNGHVAMVELLLRWGAEPGIRITADVANIPGGSNALDAAIEGGHRSCAMALLRHSRWKSALRNQSICEFQVIQTPFRKLIAFMPDVAEFVLNKCEEDQAEEPYTFEFVDDQYAFWNEAALMGQVKLCFSKSPLNYILNKWRALNLSTTSQEPCQLNHTSTEDQSQQLYCNDFYLLKENHPLMYMVRYKRSRLLQHPAVTELLRVKWNQINLLYYFNLMLYIAFLASYSVYILKAKPLDAVIHQKIKGADLRNESDHVKCVALSAAGTDSASTSVSIPTAHTVLILASINLLKEVFQMLLKGYNYVNFENLMELAIFVLAILSVADLDECRWRMQVKTSWQWQCGAMGIFLAWLNLLLFLRLVPVVGIFVLMFTVVLKSFLKFSVVFFLFIVAFTFGFHTLLVNHIAFSEVGMSLLKTFVMMLGEFEYQSTFIEGDQVGQSDPVILFSFVTYIMFPTFLIVMTILIMNLLIGLAVDDIKSVQNEATLNRRVMQIKLILDIESVLAPYPHVLANRWFGLQQHRAVKCFLSTVKRLTRMVFGKTLHLEMVTEKQRQLPARGEHLYLKRTQMSSCGIQSSAESLSKEQSCRMD